MTVCTVKLDSMSKLEDYIKTQRIDRTYILKTNSIKNNYGQIIGYEMTYMNNFKSLAFVR